MKVPTGGDGTACATSPSRPPAPAGRPPPGAGSASPLPPWPDIAAEARRLGFASAGVADIDLSDAESGLAAWLDAGFHGEMSYMARHGMTRARPAELVPGTRSAILVTMDYAPDRPEWVASAWATLGDAERAYVSRYALGRDYHKVVRSRLQRLADWLDAAVGPHGHRAFCDSAPVLEVELARRAGLGWRGKHTLLLSPQHGSTFFLGTLYTSLALAPTPAPATQEHGHCGTCTRCLEVCPTQAIVAPYRLDARRCISYLTIEYDGVIPAELAGAIGNRIYGCDDCQLICPWNRFARPAAVPDFAPRERLDAATLAELWQWTPDEFDRRLQGSAIRRIGHRRWQRNLVVAIGNAIAAGADADGRLQRLLREWLAAPAGSNGRDPVVAAQVSLALSLPRDAAAAGGDAAATAANASVDRMPAGAPVNRNGR